MITLTTDVPTAGRGRNAAYCEVPEVWALSTASPPAPRARLGNSRSRATTLPGVAHARLRSLASGEFAATYAIDT
jgi:hypothetical protein